LPAEIIQVFNGMFPDRWSKGNPVDPAGDRDMVQYMKAPEILLEHPEVHSLIFMGFGSFSGITSVFASGGSKWNLIDRVAGIKEFSAGAFEILASGDLEKIRGLFRDLLTLVLRIVMTTSDAELAEFIERLVQALTTERMLKRSFYPKITKMFKAIAAGRLKRIRMEDIGELLEPIMDALFERWLAQYGKPVITTTFTEKTATVSEGGHFPYPNSQQAALVLAKMIEYREYLEGAGDDQQ